MTLRLPPGTALEKTSGARETVRQGCLNLTAPMDSEPPVANGTTSSRQVFLGSDRFYAMLAAPVPCRYLRWARQRCPGPD